MKNKILGLITLFALLLPCLALATPSQVEFLMSGMTDTNGQPLSGGKVYTYTAGTLSNKTTWQDLGEVSSHTNPIILDAYGKKQVFADGLYKFVIKTSADVTLYTLDNLSYGGESNVPLDGGTSTGAANTYSITVAPNPLAYVTGQRFTFISHQVNTSASTININSIGSKSITSKTGQALVGGEIPNGAVIDVYYDGTTFRLISTKQLPTVGQAYSASADTESSAAFNTMTGATVTVSVKSGDYVRLNWWVTWSVDNVDTTPSFEIFEGASGIASTLATLRSTGDVGNGGDQKTHSGSYILTTPTTGSQTYTLQWKRLAGANVAYSAFRFISAEVVSP